MSLPNESTPLIDNDQAFQVAWLVYLNGIEVPAVSVVTTYGVWQIPECEITLVPDPVMKRFGAEDRVTAQVFYCDYWQNPGKPEFRLMFDGEVVGWSYVNVQGARAISLNCVDYIQIFTQLFFFFMSSIDDMAIGTSGEAIGMGPNTIKTAGYGATYPLSLFTHGLTSPTPDTDDTDPITRPIDFIYNVVRALIKKGQPNKTVPAVNFFSPWIKRTHFHKRFTALPLLEEGTADDEGNVVPGTFPILRAVQADYALAAVKRLADDVGNTGSVWEIIRQILSVLMMELNMLPTAPSVRSDYRSIEINGPPSPTSGKIQGAEAFNGLARYFVKPQFLFGIPPVSNVFFPSQIRQLAYEENYITQPTRMCFNDVSMTSFVTPPVSPGMSAIIQDELAVAHPEELNRAVRYADKNPGNSATARNLLIYPEEFFRGPVIDRRVLPRWFAYLNHARKDNEATDIPPDNSQQVPAGDPTREVYRLYAAYEFHKEKYSRRNGSVQLAFNPYPIPGFPCAAFDRRTTQVDVFGYVMRVVQSMSVAGWSTQVSFSYGRTMPEMFELLEKQTQMETEVLLEKYAEISSNVVAQKPNPENALLIGAIGMSPIEPIAEVRNVIQNFHHAESFYRALFYREQLASAYSLEKFKREKTVRKRGQEVKREGPLGFLQSSVMRTTSDEAQVAFDLPGDKKASFYYPDIIRLRAPDGSFSKVRIEGIDGAARLKYTNIIAKAHVDEATEEEMEQLNEVLETRVRQNTISEDNTKALNQAEMYIRTLPPKTNLAGDKEVHPTAAAQRLFKSYYAAMQYSARPVCTLDEYIDFLGVDGLKENKINPNTALATQSSRTFPAHYYVRIRRYRPGPPANTPATNITGTPFVSSPDGMNVSASVPGATTAIDGIPEDFPDTIKDWDAILLQYRENVLIKLAPKD